MVWASPEVSGHDLPLLVGGSELGVGVLVYGRTELRVAEHCILMAQGPCAGRCTRCARRQGRWSLKDRKRYDFPVRIDAAGRSHLYNSVPLDLTRALPDIVAAGVCAVRMDLHTESADEAASLVAACRSRLGAVVSGGDAPAGPLTSPSTSGHYFRGLR